MYLSKLGKRFRWLFCPFEAFVAVVRAKIGASARNGRSGERESALAPIFARPKSEKCLKPAETLWETLATQAIRYPMKK